MQPRHLAALLVLTALVLAPLAGCGKKGRLELPQPHHEKTKEKSE